MAVIGLGTWLTSRLGFDPRHAVTLLDWLATPALRLVEITAGEVFHDGPGELSRARAALAYYPHDVWLYVLACQWQRIGQEEPFPPPLDTRTRRFFDRPYRVIGAGRFAAALREAITDPRIGELPLTGAIDQVIDSTDAIGELRFLRACAAAAIGLTG